MCSSRNASPLKPGLAEPEEKAKPRILLVPQRKVGTPHIIVEIAMDALEQIRLLVCKLQQRGLAWCNQRRIQRLQQEAPLPSLVAHLLLDRVQTPIATGDDLQRRDRRPQLGEGPTRWGADARLK